MYHLLLFHATYLLALALTSAPTLAAPSGTGAPAATVPTAPPAVCLPCETERLLFEASLDDFMAAAKQRQPAGLVWHDNGCGAGDGITSLVPDKPLGFDFGRACARHDFGYDNYLLTAPPPPPAPPRARTEADRKRVDEQFRRDMLAACAKQKGSVPKALCKGLAEGYYKSVRELGVKFWKTQA